MHMNLDIEHLKRVIVPILQKAGATRSAIFGSVARNQATAESDIDILVELKERMGLFGFIALQQQLEDALHKKVDLVEYEALKPRIREKILREQIPIL